VDISEGTFTLTNEQGSLTLRTSREGIGSRAGHDLTIDVTRWRAEVERGNGRTKIEAEIDPTSLEVREGTGGVKPLTDKDRKDIKQDLEGKVLEVDQHPRIAFTASSPVGWEESAAGESSARGVVEGDLELHGQRDLLQLDVEVTRVDGAVRLLARTSIPQSRWGIAPYRGFLGALKVADPVEAELDVTVPGA
jgi:polyisoprenoid-binding protein YceI